MTPKKILTFTIDEETTAEDWNDFIVEVEEAGDELNEATVYEKENPGAIEMAGAWWQHLRFGNVADEEQDDG